MLGRASSLRALPVSLVPRRLHVSVAVAPVSPPIPSSLPARARTHACTHARTHAHTHTHTIYYKKAHIIIHAHTVTLHTRTGARMHIGIGEHTHTHTTHIHTHIYTHTHTHSLSLSLSPSVIFLLASPFVYPYILFSTKYRRHQTQSPPPTQPLSGVGKHPVMHSDALCQSSIRQMLLRPPCLLPPSYPPLRPPPPLSPPRTPSIFAHTYCASCELCYYR